MPLQYTRRTRAFLDQVDRRTGPQLTPQQETNIVANMPPLLRDEYAQSLKSNPNDAYRLLRGISENPRFDITRPSESSIVANMNPLQRDLYNQLLTTRAARA